MGILDSVKNIFGSSGASESEEVERIEERENEEDEEIERIRGEENTLENQLQELVGKERELETAIADQPGHKEIEYYPEVLENTVEVFEQLRNLAEELETVEEQLADAVEREEAVESLIEHHEEKLEENEEELEQLERKVEEELENLLSDITQILGQAYRNSGGESDASALDNEMMINILNVGAPDYWHNLENRMQRLSEIQKEEFREARNFLFDEKAWERVEQVEEEQVDELEQEFEELKSEVDLLQDSEKEEEEILESAESIVQEFKQRDDFQHMKQKREEASLKTRVNHKGDEFGDKMSTLMRKVEKVRSNSDIFSTVFEEVSEKSSKIYEHLERLEELKEKNNQDEKRIIQKLESIDETLAEAEKGLSELKDMMDQQISDAEKWISLVERYDVQTFVNNIGIDPSKVERNDENIEINIGLYRYNAFSVKCYIVGYSNVPDDKIRDYMPENKPSREFKDRNNRKGLLPQIENYRQNFEKARTQHPQKN